MSFSNERHEILNALHHFFSGRYPLPLRASIFIFARVWGSCFDLGYTKNAIDKSNNWQMMPGQTHTHTHTQNTLIITIIFVSCVGTSNVDAKFCSSRSRRRWRAEDRRWNESSSYFDIHRHLAVERCWWWWRRKRCQWLYIVCAIRNLVKWCSVRIPSLASELGGCDDLTKLNG